VSDGLIPFVGKTRLDNVLYGVRDKHKLLTVCYCCECCCISRFSRLVPMKHLEPAFTRLPGIEITVSEECTGCGECGEICFMKAIDARVSHR